MKQSSAAVETASRCLAVLEVLPTTPTGDLVMSCIREGRYLDLHKVPHPKFSSDFFAVEYFAFNLLRKYPFVGIDREKVALANFMACETKCAQTNGKLAVLSSLDNEARTRISWIRDKITHLLGDFDWNAASLGFAWGPGATTRLANSEGDVYYKFRGSPETTLANLPLAEAAIASIPLWFENHQVESTICSIVPGGRITTVPKDAKTDRVIEVQPCMNTYIQKGIGSLIRDRLRRVGINLRSQETNQELARTARTRSHATIDLSNASDTISSKTVELLIRDDWFAALQRCRTPRYVLSGEIKTAHRFSSMGNGYTFELETLIFWGLAQRAIYESGCMDRTCAIYGDDIIIPSLAVGPLYELFDLFGFTPNKEKSFIRGPFYESCGKHYFWDAEVTPLYIKEEIVSPRRAAWFANSILRWIVRVNKSLDYFLQSVPWLTTLRWVPDMYRLHIPEGVGDGGLIVPDCHFLEVTDFGIRKPSESRALKRHLRRRETPSYGRGVWYRFVSETYSNTRERDPEDVPYYLRSLYRLEQVPSHSDFGLPWEHDAPAGIIKVKVVGETSGWCSSWGTLTIGSPV